MSEERMCQSCGIMFRTNRWGNFKCNICQQTERLANQADAAQREQRRRDREYNNQMEYAARMNADAILKQNIATQESVVSINDAYNCGYQYVDGYDFPNGNSMGLKILIHDDGSISYGTRTQPYWNPHLQQSWSRGLSDSLRSVRGNLTYLKNSARSAGKENAYATLPPAFSLHTGINLNGVNIPTTDFDSKFTFDVDKKTGELKMHFQKPFKNEEFNQAYTEGVNEAYAELNTEEKKLFRLQQCKLAKKIKLQDKLLKGSIISFPFIAWYLLWHLTTGFTALVSFVLVPVLFLMMEKLIYMKWWYSKNEDYIKYSIWI